MIIYEKPIEYYVRRLKANDYFSLPGYGDAAWICMLNVDGRMGQRTGFGMLMTEETGKKIHKTMQFFDRNYLKAAPKCLNTIFNNGEISNFFNNHPIPIREFYERDMILDDLAQGAGLFPLIDQLRKMDIVFVGHPALEGLDFLNIKKFIPVKFPDFHLDQEGMDDAVKQCREYGKPAVYLFAAGMSSAMMIAELHDTIPKSFFIDVGSIFDAFVGIGGQREWREKLYANPEKLEKWKHDNLYGKS